MSDFDVVHDYIVTYLPGRRIKAEAFAALDRIGAENARLREATEMVRWWSSGWDDPEWPEGGGGVAKAVVAQVRKANDDARRAPALARIVSSAQEALEWLDRERGSEDDGPHSPGYYAGIDKAWRVLKRALEVEGA